MKFNVGDRVRVTPAYAEPGPGEPLITDMDRKFVGRTGVVVESHTRLGYTDVLLDDPADLDLGRDSNCALFLDNELEPA